MVHDKSPPLFWEGLLQEFRVSICRIAINKEILLVFFHSHCLGLQALSRLSGGTASTDCCAQEQVVFPNQILIGGLLVSLLLSTLHFFKLIHEMMQPAVLSIPLGKCHHAFSCIMQSLQRLFMPGWALRDHTVHSVIFLYREKKINYDVTQPAFLSTPLGKAFLMSVCATLRDHTVQSVSPLISKKKINYDTTQPAFLSTPLGKAFLMPASAASSKTFLVPVKFLAEHSQ